VCAFEALRLLAIHLTAEIVKFACLRPAVQRLKRIVMIFILQTTLCVSGTRTAAIDSAMNNSKKPLLA